MRSLEQRMEQPGERQKLITLLNNVDLYTKIVRQCRYQQIAIQVLRNGEELFAYTSFNDRKGSIIKVEKGRYTPNLVAYVEEAVLMEILDRAEELKEQPVSAALQYAGKFKIRPWSAYSQIFWALINS